MIIRVRILFPDFLVSSSCPSPPSSEGTSLLEGMNASHSRDLAHADRAADAVLTSESLYDLLANPFSQASLTRKVSGNARSRVSRECSRRIRFEGKSTVLEMEDDAENAKLEINASFTTRCYSSRTMFEFTARSIWRGTEIVREKHSRQIQFYYSNVRSTCRVHFRYDPRTIFRPRSRLESASEMLRESRNSLRNERKKWTFRSRSRASRRSRVVTPIARKVNVDVRTAFY